MNPEKLLSKCEIDTKLFIYCTILCIVRLDIDICMCGCAPVYVCGFTSKRTYIKKCECLYLPPFVNVAEHGALQEKNLLNIEATDSWEAKI